MEYSQREYIERINDLYIMTRSKFILQRQDGKGYTTMYKPKLNDSLIRQHLKQSITVGIFAGKYLNKFMCFDIDCKEQSEAMTKSLVECLQHSYGFEDRQILVSFSGSKGYHVELFFDKAMPVKDLHMFYHLVLAELEADTTQIEFRNTFTQAVKLPLSLNWKTHKKCYLVDIHNLTELDDSHLFNVEKVDTELFIEQLKEMWADSPVQPIKKPTMALENDLAEQFEAVAANMKTHLDIDYQARAIAMINSEKLLYPNSRHNSTLLLGSFFKDQGYELQDSIGLVYHILENTWHTARHFYSSDTTLEHIEAETVRLVTLVYEKGYSFGKPAYKPIRITKEDVIAILKPKKIHLRQLLFTMTCHSKRFAKADGSFYMTYKQMSDMGNTACDTRLTKYVTELADQECIGIVSRNERKEKSHLHKPNVYSIKAEQTALDDVTFVELNEINVSDFDRVITQLIPETELKQLVTKNQFYKSFKQYYTA